MTRQPNTNDEEPVRVAEAAGASDIGDRDIEDRDIEDREAEDRGGSPVRTCIVTRDKRDPGEMIRFVLAPDGTVTADIRNKLPGRGVWVTCSARLVGDAVKRKSFERGFKKPAKTAEALVADVDAMLERDALQMLALANKAGLVLAGFGKVSTDLESGGLAALVQAHDGGADGKRKLGQTVRRAGREVGNVELFSSDQLGLALGRTNVIHAALKHGSAAKAFLKRCERLRAYRAAEAGVAAADTTKYETQKTRDASGPGPGFGTDE